MNEIQNEDEVDQPMENKPISGTSGTSSSSFSIPKLLKFGSHGGDKEKEKEKTPKSGRESRDKRRKKPPPKRDGSRDSRDSPDYTLPPERSKLPKPPPVSSEKKSPSRPSLPAMSTGTVEVSEGGAPPGGAPPEGDTEDGAEVRPEGDEGEGAAPSVPPGSPGYGSSGDSEDDAPHVEGAYDYNEFAGLQCEPEVKQLFEYILRYTPQTIELDTQLRPFLPDYIPAVGDIDAFIKVTRPDEVSEQVGLGVLDEPCAGQSDPTVLDLQLRQLTKQAHIKASQIKSIEHAENNPKVVESWISNISKLHRDRPPPTVHYNRTMPDIDTLMQEWPTDFEELLKSVSLPGADVDMNIQDYTDIVCSLLDIPIYKSRIQSLHVLFSLYSEFINSQHFRQLAQTNNMENVEKPSTSSVGDRLMVGDSMDTEPDHMAFQ